MSLIRNVNRLALKLLKTDQKWTTTSRSLSNSVFMSKNRGEISSAIQINAPTKRFISTSVYKSSNATSSNSSGGGPKPFNLGQSILNTFNLIGLRLKISFQMYQLDKSFRLKEFIKGAKQVSSFIRFLTMLIETKVGSCSVNLKGSYSCL